jgi:hypothetical protein
MDSLTQIALGAATAALVAPSEHRRAALTAGAILGTLPDLDIIPLFLSRASAVDFVTWHRGPSHSLFVLAVAGWLMAYMGTGPRGAPTVVLDNRVSPAYASTARCLYCLRHAAILAAAVAADHVGEHIYHRSGLHRSAASGLSGCLVLASSSLGDLVFVRGHHDELGLSRVVVGGKGARGRRCSGRPRQSWPARRSSFLGPDALYDTALACRGADTPWIPGR